MNESASSSEPAGALQASPRVDDEYTEPRYRRFVYLAAALAGSGVLALAALNVVVDPFTAFRIVDVPSLRGRRVAVGETRTGKAEMLLHGAPRTVLLGTSRTDVGIDPSLPEWRDPSVLNLGMGGASISESYEIFRASLRLPSVRRVVLFTELSAFNSQRKFYADFSRSRFRSPNGDANYVMSNLFSRYATESSISTVQNLRKGITSLYDERGFRSGHDPLRHGGSYRTLFKQTVWSALRNPEGYRNFLYTPESSRLVREMAREARARGISLQIVLSPVHAVGLEAIRVSGLWSTFRQWKTDIVAAVAANPGEAPVPVWDFAKYSSVAAEPIPPDGPNGQSVAKMTWFWEASHFTSALGRRVVARITESPEAGDGELGELLVLAALPSHLDAVDAGREKYAAEHADEINFVREIANRALRSGPSRP